MVQKYDPTKKIQHSAPVEQTHLQRPGKAKRKSADELYQEVLRSLQGALAQSRVYLNAGNGVRDLTYRDYIQPRGAEVQQFSLDQAVKALLAMGASRETLGKIVAGTATHFFSDGTR
jgi:hypothetical protein